MSEPLDTRHRLAALSGIGGVGTFVGAWSIFGAVRPEYSPISDAISQLGAIDAPNRWGMNVGFAAFGIGVPVYSLALRKAMDSNVWAAAMITGLATLGVGANPLGRHDTAHYIFAALGYVTLAAVPLLASREFRSNGMNGWARFSVLCGTSSSIFMAASVADPAHGLTQRLGLGITDIWIAATAWKMFRSGRLLD